MSGGMSLLLLSFLAANFSGTLFNEYTISQYGHIAVPIFAAFLAYVTIKYEAFEPRILFIDTLVAALVILLISLFFVEDQNYQIYVNIITLLIVIPLGYSLVTGIRKETSARKQIELQEKELELANTHLKELDKLKSEFVSLATHQIRAPLTAIKGYLSEIFEGDFGPLPPALQPPLNTMMQSNENLINIVGDFLNISRIEQGRMVYEFSSFDLGTVTKEVGDSLKPNLDRAHLDFSVEVEPNHNYIVSGDIGKTKQIIGNIIDNAIKYTPQGWIKLQVTKTPAGMVRVTIKDSGVGVTADTIPKLFQKFSRATDANKTNVVGTGLGLYVVKTMVEAQHGKVWVESEGAGKGSTFIVEFPAVHVS